VPVSVFVCVIRFGFGGEQVAAAEMGGGVDLQCITSPFHMAVKLIDERIIQWGWLASTLFAAGAFRVGLMMMH